MRTRVAVLVASLAASSLSWPDLAAAIPPQLRSTPTVPDEITPTPVPRHRDASHAAGVDAFGADVTVRRHVVRKDGSKVNEAPVMRYRWERRLADAEWKSTLTVLSVAPSIVETGKGPRTLPAKIPVSRIEIGGPGTPTRAYDAAGKPVFLLPSRHREPRAVAAPEATAGTDAPTIARVTPALSPAAFEPAGHGAASSDWIDQLLPRIEGRDARQRALARGHGQPRSSVRGLDRFVSTRAGEVTEVLSDPAWAVPVEINVTRDGALVSHSRLSYRQDPGAGLVRQRYVTERLISPESGDRAIVDVELDNVRLGRRGTR
jgi:hypothetical protein